MIDWKQIMMAATFMVPMQEAAQWQVLKYDSIPAHKVEFKKDGLNINVHHSASPVIYPLKKPLKISAIKIKGQLKGQLNLASDQEQGAKGLDDYVLRVGLVTRGDKTLNFFQRAVAADWVKKLYSLAPEDTGIEQIFFLNVGQQEKHLHDQRKHPLSDLIHEKVQWIMKGSQEFELQSQLEQPLETLALWIAVDGDDTESDFHIRLEKLELDVVEEGVNSDSSDVSDSKASDPGKSVSNP